MARHGSDRSRLVKQQGMPDTLSVFGILVIAFEIFFNFGLEKRTTRERERRYNRECNDAFFHFSFEIVCVLIKKTLIIGVMILVK